MKSHNKVINGFTLFAVVITILLVTSPAAAAPALGPVYTLDTFSTTPNVELGSVVAGIDQAVYASIFTFGGDDGSNIPVDTALDGLDNAQSWVLASIHQSDFATYLQRSPSPVSAPDGLSLHLTYPAGSGNTQSLGWAVEAAVAFEALYGVSFALMAFDTSGTHDYLWWANNTAVADIESAVADDVDALGNGGLSTLLDADTITAAPVFWSAYGVRGLAGQTVVQFGAGWVDADGLQDMGSGVYKLSSANIFGGPVNPSTLDPALSRVTFTVPYPIAPTTGGISPATSNPLPHVTGIAQWDLAHPIDFYGMGGKADLVMEFEVKTDSSFPNVQTKFSIDQALLNSEGTLEGTFEIKNVGSEAAENIDLFFPVGPDFDAIANQNRSIITIRDDFALDVDYDAKFNVSIYAESLSTSTVVQDINAQFLDYAGWYEFTSNQSIAYWDGATTELVLIDQVFGSAPLDTQVTVKILSPTGFPEFIVQLVTDLAASLDGASTASEALDAVRAALPGLVTTALNQTVETFYEKQQIFYVKTGDFNLDRFQFQSSEDSVTNYWFMTSTDHTLAAGESKTLSFRIENVPVASDTFQFVEFEGNTFEQNGVTLPNATITSSAENWYQVMQYLFQNIDYDGRPLSFGYENSVSFGLDAFNLDSFHSQQYVSFGSLVRFENTNGYPFFSLSNGQNLQVADDEAVVSAVLHLDKQVYYPDEDKTVTVELENTGDLDAENLKVHLYHATLGRNWAFERRFKIATLDVGTLEAGQTLNVSHVAQSNSFVGYSPVFAYVEFDSDVGQGAAQVPDYLDLGVTEYEAAAETHHIVTSTLTGALLVPRPGDVGLNPTIKEPKVEISSVVSDVNADDEFTVTFTLDNTGEANTTVYFGQFYETADFTLLDSSDDADAIKQSNVQGDYGWVYYSGINLPEGTTKTVTLTFRLESNAGTLYPAFAYFVIAGESTLGGRADTGGSQSVGGTSVLELAAGSQAQQDSQQSANTDSSSSSYSASSSVGASINTDIPQTTNTAEGIGFIGYDAAFLGLMLIPMGLVSFLRRRR